MIDLVRTSVAYIDSIEQYKMAFEKTGESLDGTSCLINYNNLMDWFEFLKALEKGITDKKFVPALSYCLVNTQTNTVIGMADLRLTIDNNDYLSQYGGHIGYSIHPNYRQKGYGKLQLSLLLEKARLIGLEEVLVTCNNTNIISQKIIEFNGGQFEKIVYEPEGTAVRRYWITL